MNLDSFLYEFFDLTSAHTHTKSCAKKEHILYVLAY
jgi:hypothetical protein